MKKIFPRNNKGFVLAETLIVAVAVVTIFTIIFQEFYPLMGEYERRENFDDIDSKYGTYWFKRMIQSNDYNLTAAKISEIDNKGFTLFKCDDITDNYKKNMCNQMLINLEVSCDNQSTKDKIEDCSSGNQPHIFITRYRLVKIDAPTYNLKTKFKTSKEEAAYKNIISDGLIDYLSYLPMYSKVGSLNGAEYRIIIEYYRHRFDTQRYKDASGTVDQTAYEVDDENDFRTYSTIEVKK